MSDPLASVSAAAVKATHARIRESMHPAAGFRGTHVRDHERETDPNALTEAQHPVTADLSHSLYNTQIHLPKHNGPVTAKFASGSEHKVLRRLAPTMTKAKHAELSLAHSKAADAHDAAWSKARAKAHQTTFGKEPGIADYKVSGVGRDEYSDKDKETLRTHARAASDHRIIGHAHAKVAGGPAMRTAGATNEEIDSVIVALPDDTDGVDLTEWENVDKYKAGKYVMVNHDRMKVHQHQRVGIHTKHTVLHVGHEGGATHEVHMGQWGHHTIVPKGGSPYKNGVPARLDAASDQKSPVHPPAGAAPAHHEEPSGVESVITAANLQELAGALAGAHAVATEHGATVTHRGLGKGITVRHSDKAKAETIHAALKHHGFTVGAVRSLGDQHHFHVGHPTQQAEDTVEETEHALGARVVNKLAADKPYGKGEVIFHRRDSNTHKVTKYKVKQDDGAITHWDAENTKKESLTTEGKTPYTFSFHPGDGADHKRITWKRHGTDTNSVHDLAKAAALKDYPKAHTFKTDSPQDEAATDMHTDNTIAAGGAQFTPEAQIHISRAKYDAAIPLKPAHVAAMKSAKIKSSWSLGGVTYHPTKPEHHELLKQIYGEDIAPMTADEIAEKAKLSPGTRFATLVKSVGNVKAPAYTEAEGTFTSKPEHRFQTADGQHEYRGGRNTTAGTFDHRHYVKKGAGWKHVPDHGYDGHDSAEDAAASAKGDRDSHDALNAKKESQADERAVSLQAGVVQHHDALEPHLLATLKAHGGSYHGKQPNAVDGAPEHHFTIPAAHAAAHNAAYNAHVNARLASHKDVGLGHYALTGVGEGVVERSIAAGAQMVKAARQDASAQLKTHVAAFKLHKAAGRRDDARGALKLAKNAKIRLATLSHESTGVEESLEEMHDLAIDLAELAGAEFLGELAADTYETYRAARDAGARLPEGSADVMVHTTSAPVHVFGPAREDQHRCVVTAEGHPPLGFFETEAGAFEFATAWSTKHLLSTHIHPLAI